MASSTPLSEAQLSSAQFTRSGVCSQAVLEFEGSVCLEAGDSAGASG
ncbi:hypothetical protein ABIB54_002232 [Frigoribacterium sp. UYMn621]